MPDRKESREIEVTPEMIEAGEDVLLSTLGGGVSVHWLPSELAASVYRAMRLAENDGQPTGQ